MHVRLESLPPGWRTDPGGVASEGAAGLHIERLVADHPGVPRTHAEIARGGEEHPGARLTAGAPPGDVMGGKRDSGNTGPFLPKGRKHAGGESPELAVRDQIPPRR